MGCHGSECDVWLTIDDSLVVYHDAKRNEKRLDASTYEEVVSELLANGEKIPTLREYILCSKEYPHTKLIIDLKTSKVEGRTEKMVEMIHNLVCEMDYEAYVEYLISYLPAYEVLKTLSDRPIAYLGTYRRQIHRCIQTVSLHTASNIWTIIMRTIWQIQTGSGPSRKKVSTLMRGRSMKKN